ncbi:MAG TPA: ACT domain-containing protein [Kineosporiaceae bacterium]
MRLVMSPQAIAVVGLPAGADEPTWATGGPLVSITRTENETSVICPTSAIPEEVPGPVNGPLVGVYVDEQLDFSQVGILVGLLKPLADAGIPVLTLSTYDTDWVLIEASRAAAASSVWRAAGYQVVDAAEHRDDPWQVDVREEAGESLPANARGAAGPGGPGGRAEQ